MLELGDVSKEAHEHIGRLLSSSPADLVFLYGQEIKAAAAVMKAAGERVPFFHTQDMEELSRTLDRYILAGDLVLLKASRGCALERLSGMLTGGGE
jgi:UDP-N-acetylmuramoyl-tripeptide--D-alanyl-D-alanine ligase